MHPLTQEDLISSNTRVKVEEFPNYLFCVFYAIEKAKTVKLLDIDFILGNNFLITNHTKEVYSFNELKENMERLAQLLLRGPDFLFHYLLDTEIDYYFPVLERIDDHLEGLEEEVTKMPMPRVLNRILEEKRLLSLIRKTTFAHREKISFLAKVEFKFVSKAALPYFRDIYDHAVRISDKVDNSREMVSNAFDLYMSSVSNKTNEIMKVLSVFATIALPLTVVSSIYGTNFEVLPGAHNPAGFWLMMCVTLGLSFGFMYFFRRKGWF